MNTTNDFEIPAECHSDDRCCEIEFNALSWFEQASDEDLQDLVDCGFRGDYPSDKVAIYYADYIEDIRAMFQYIEIRQRFHHIGFECSVDEESAMKWLCRNRPHLNLSIG